MELLQQQMNPDARAIETLGQELWRRRRGDRSRLVLTLASSAVTFPANDSAIDDRLDFDLFAGITLSEVREWLGKALAAFPITIHAITNSTIELDGDRATGKTLVNNPMVIPQEDGGQHQFTVWAWYIDELVRTDDGWRIAKRFEQQVFVESAPPAGHEIPK